MKGFAPVTASTPSLALPTRGMEPEENTNGRVAVDPFESDRATMKYMDTIPPQLLQAALALPESARADLAAELIASLDPAVDADYDTAWDAEIKRRIEQLDSGTVKCIPWEELRAELLGEQRAAATARGSGIE